MCQTPSYMLLIILVISLKGSKTAPSWFFHFCCVNLGIYLAIRHSVSFALYDECVCVCVCVCVHIHAYTYISGCPGGSGVQNLPANAGDSSIPGSGRSPGKGNGSPLWNSCLGNPMDGGAWQATVHGVVKELDMTERLNSNNK